VVLLVVIDVASLGCGAGDVLISPCMCKGTQQFVHRSCLDHWRSVKVTPVCVMCVHSFLGTCFSYCALCQI
jgi:E3 ubiquitin-protein ligase DOA10